MRFGVLGTGVVGRTLGGKLLDVGHDVRMGSRSAGNEGRSNGRPPLEPAQARARSRTRRSSVRPS